jgi:hypothetical protein
MDTKFQQRIPTTWRIAALAIFPGLLAVIGLTTLDYSFQMIICIGLLLVYVFFAYIWNKKHLPSWSLMAVGILVSFCLSFLVGLIGALISILVGKMVDISLAVILWIAIFLILALFIRKNSAPKGTWIMVGLIAFMQLLMRVKYFILLGVSWEIAIEWLAVSLYASAILLMLPVCLGLPLIRKHGKWFVLYAIGSVFMGFQTIIDVYQKVSIQIGGTFWFSVYKIAIPLIFTVIAVLWFLKVKNERIRLPGLLVLVGVAVAANIVVVGISYEDFPLIIWLSSIPYTISVLLTFILVYRLGVFYHRADPSLGESQECAAG